MDEFLAARLGRITASKDFARILRGHNLVKEKVNEVITGDYATPDRQNYWMRRGTVMELEAQEHIIQGNPTHNIQAVSRKPIQHKKSKWIAATPDMISRKHRYCVEIKCPQTEGTIQHAATMKEPPKAVQLQIMAQLWVVGYKRAMLFYYNTTLGIFRKFDCTLEKRYIDLFEAQVMPQAKAIGKALHAYGYATPKERIQ